MNKGEQAGRETVFVDVLVARAPRLRSWWNGHKASSDFLPGLPYISLGALAEQMVECLRLNQTKELRELFAELESLLERATQAERKLIVVGLLETVQNVSLNSGIRLEAWHRWLGTCTMRDWALVVALWSGELSPAAFNAALGDNADGTTG